MATKLDLADAQFIGFGVGKREPGIIILIQGMGLTKKEWETWKKKYPTYPLQDDEIQEVDEYFENEVVEVAGKKFVKIKS